MRHTCGTHGGTHHESRSTEDESMLKFILLVFSVFTSLVAATHTVSFVMHGQMLLATITALYFVCGTFMAAALIQLERTQ